MDVENMIWHYPAVVTRHSLYGSFGSTLSLISERDYPGKDYFSHDIPAIDLDRLEASLDGDNDCTVDAVVGVCNERQGMPVAGRHLLVELRMKYKNLDNIDIERVSRKYTHSVDLLRECHDHVHVDSSLCLLFDPSVESQMIRWHARKKGEGKPINHWFMFTPHTFDNHINAGRTMPYTPKKETLEVCRRFVENISENDIQQLSSMFSAYLRYMEKCRQRYEKGEYVYLMDCLEKCMTDYDRESLDNEDDELLFTIIQEDVARLRASFENWVSGNC